MSRRPATVTQANIARALRAVEQCGLKMAVEISPNGTIRIVPAERIEIRPVEPVRDFSL